MHRTTFSPRYAGWNLVLGLVLGALANSASAQDRLLPAFGLQPPDATDGKGGTKGPQEPYILVLAKDSTRQIEMSTKELITEFRSENPKVVKVQALLDNPRAVLVSGVGYGITRVYLTDVKKNTESLEIRVLDDEETVQERKRGILEDLIKKTVPTANVTVILVGPSRQIVLSGTVRNAESIDIILKLARSIFPSAPVQGNQGTVIAVNSPGAAQPPRPADTIINNMRIEGVQQVQIEVTIARVDRTKARNIGFSFLETGSKHYLASSVGGGGVLTATSALPSILAPAASLSATPNALFGIFNDKQGFFGYLNALTQENLAKIIAEPRVITLSGRPAYIVSGGQVPVLTSSGTGAPNVSYQTFGTVVNFLPIVLGDGRIHLEVRPEISNINQANSLTIQNAIGPPTQIDGFDIRSAQVAVEMEDGQTLAIGGLIQHEINATNNKVPILGDIPFLAFFFTNKTYTEEEQELIILVTPHLVGPLACCQLPKYLPGRETRTPDDFELFLEGILEAPRGQRTLTKPYTAAYLNGPTGAKYPCGDVSGCSGTCAGNTCATGACNAPPPPAGSPASAAAPQKSDARMVGDTVPETPATVPGPRYIREPVPMAPTQPATPAQPPAPAQPVSAAAIVTPANLPMLPPVTNLGAPTETRLPPAAFGTAILTDR